MSICVINPNGSKQMTKSLKMAWAKNKNTELDILFEYCPESPLSIEGYSDGVMASSELVKRIKSIEKNPAFRIDAYVIACFDDTGLDAAREITDKPVIGISEAAFHTASLISKKFSVVTTLSRSISIIEENLEKYGLIKRCAGVFASGIPVLALEADPNSYEYFLKIAKESLQTSRGEALILGCAGMANWVARLEDDLNIPVIDGVRCGIFFARSLIELNIKTSKIGAYAPPEIKHTELC